MLEAEENNSSGLFEVNQKKNATVSMKYLFLFLSVFLFGTNLSAQYKLQIIVHELSFKKHDSIYITGNFNSWNPGNSQYKLQPVDSLHKTITLNLPRGRYEYKFTGGDWVTVEKDIECQEIENRVVQLNSDTTLNLVIENWKDVCLSQDTSVASIQLLLKKQQDDSNKVVTLNRLSLEMYHHNDLKNARDYATAALSLAEKINFKRGEATAYKNLGIVQLDQYNYTEGRKNLYAALKIYQELKNKLRSTYTNDLIGGSYLQEENYPEALQFYYANLRSYENLGDKTSIARSQYDIAQVYVLQDNDQEALKKFQEALTSYKESLELYKEDWIKSAIGMCYNSIASIYLDQNNFATALACDSTARKMFEESGDQSGLAMVRSTNGDIYQKQGMVANNNGDKKNGESMYRRAISEYQHALQIFEALGSMDGIAGSYVSIGKINMRLKNFDKAETYLEQGQKLSKEIGSKEQLKECFRSMTELDSLQGNFQKAYQHYKLYISYRDSLNNEETKKKSLQSQMQYEFDKKESAAKAEQDKKDVLTTAEISREKVVRDFSVGGVFAMLSLGGFVFYNFRKRKKLESEQALSNERLRISRELHDDIGSTLGSIAVYSDVARNRSVKNESPAEVLSKIGTASRELIEKMSDIVWSLNPDNETFEQLQNRIQGFAAMILTPRNIQIEFKTDHELKTVQLTSEQRKNIFLIYKEAIHNIVKYAECKNVVIELSRSDSTIKMVVKDDGKGFDTANNTAYNGNGIKNMNARAEDMKSSLLISSKINEGTTIELSLKVA